MSFLLACIMQILPHKIFKQSGKLMASALPTLDEHNDNQLVSPPSSDAYNHYRSKYFLNEHQNNTSLSKNIKQKTFSETSPNEDVDVLDDEIGTLEEEGFKGELALLRQNALEATQMIDAMPTGLVVLDGNGIVMRSNQVATKLLCHNNKSEALNSNDLPQKLSLTGLRWLTIINNVFQPREDDGHEVSLKSGQRVKLEISALADKPGQLIIITDLTQTRLLQDKLGQLQRLSSLGRMVSSLAHQIRTPLSAAMLYSANLNKSLLSDSNRLSFQEKLHSRLQDLEQRVNDMLLFSKSGKEQVVSPLSVNALIKDAVNAMEVIVNKENGRVKVQYCEKEHYILANKSALSGAIQNLIHNALQAYVQLEENDQISGVEITIQVYCQKNNAYISVKDNGVGISTELKNKIFQPFYTSSIQGTGLGLAVVKSVLNAHQGSVALLSDTGEGAHFCLTLPLIDANKLEESMQNKERNNE